MKKKHFIIALIFGLILFSCNFKKNEKTKDNEYQEEENRIDYTQAENLTTEISYIFNEGYNFSEEIRINEIGYVKTGNNTYKIVYFLDEESNLSKIQNLNIAFRIYPKDTSLFATEADKKAGAKTLASKCKIQEMGGSLVIVSNEFSIIPKSFAQIKVYIYDPKDGIYGKMMTLLNIEFS
ncbi:MULTISPECIES: hypothetical protein [Arenibacter]|uniref:hypothetical protein n=1 Tax=Arenibacter TaxID=178469 RepID=UPI0004DF0E2A|nr:MULTISPECIES: hypothetical protein [Arenibacter]GBF18507.1 hypothetical protein C21_00665 [Arenibacter sp. NBRC 103722]